MHVAEANSKYGEEAMHVAEANSKFLLATALEDLGHSQRARTLFRSAAAVFSLRLGHDHPYTIGAVEGSEQSSKGALAALDYGGDAEED
ncbi:hypothetical protein T484DRAFT_1905180 [Baffinella frigidus]|nr:hypothetical protein T484DRAFT_1905180 [Cryptophyta sp. CCMP2293]